MTLRAKVGSALVPTDTQAPTLFFRRFSVNVPSPLLVYGDGLRLGGVPKAHCDGRFEDSCRTGGLARRREGEAAEQSDWAADAEERGDTRQEPVGHD